MHKARLPQKTKQMSSSFPTEALIWLGGLGLLAFMPADLSVHYTLCPLAQLGFSFCPGCGLGHAIAHVFQGNFAGAFSSHPLGLFAVGCLGFRCFHLLKNSYLAPVVRC